MATPARVCEKSEEVLALWIIAPPTFGDIDGIESPGTRSPVYSIKRVNNVETEYEKNGGC